jgi:hypothetical protein
MKEMLMKNWMVGALVFMPFSLWSQTLPKPHVSIQGCTIEGRNYAEDVSCQVVRKQGRPFRPIPAPREPDPNDARLQDPQFMEEVAWITKQVRSCGCACCHDTSKMSDYALWDINKPYIWTDQLTPRGVAILGGQVSSAVFGQIPPEDNFGFDRSQTGAPTTDTERFKAYFQKEIDRRGITAEDIAKMRPL